MTNWEIIKILKLFSGGRGGGRGVGDGEVCIEICKTFNLPMYISVLLHEVFDYCSLFKFITASEIW